MTNPAARDRTAAGLACRLSWLERTAVGTLRFLPGGPRKGLSTRALVAVRGSIWTIAGYGGSQILRLAAQVILARMLLGPEAFGLVALVSVFLSGLEMLSDLGIGTDVVQHPRGDDPRFINTAFQIQAVRGLILFAIAAGLARPFASFYQQPAVAWMIFVAALSIGLRGLASGSVWTMTRHVRLAKLTGLTVGADFAGLVVSLVWATISPSAWALVVGRVASTVVFVAGSHAVAEHRISWDWDARAAKDILMFGTGMFLSSATYFLSGEAERLVIGKFITVAELGCFSLALALSAAPSRGVQQVMGQVFFPMISQAVREDRAAAGRDFRRVRTLVLAAGVVLGCGFILLGPAVSHLLLGAKYADVGWMLQLLGFRAALEFTTTAAGSTLFAIGLASYSAIGNACKLVFLCGGLFLAFSKFGFREAVWVLALSQLAHYVPHVLGLKRHFKDVAGTELVCMAVFLGSTLAAALVAAAIT